MVTTKLEEQPALAPQTHPNAMIQVLDKAIDKGIDADSLGKIVALHERLMENHAKELFAQAMNACQAEMPCIVRDAQNTQTNSGYATLENVQTIAKPVYTKHGFALSFGEEDCQTPGFKRIICDVRHRAGHMVRYHHDLPIDGIGPKGNPIGGMNAVQGCISTGSYGQRVLACRIFNITIADTDRDGQKTTKGATEGQLKELSDLVALYRRGFPSSHEADSWYESWMQWVSTACKRKVERFEELTEAEATVILKGTKELVARRKK